MVFKRNSIHLTGMIKISLICSILLLAIKEESLGQLFDYRYKNGLEKEKNYYSLKNALENKDSAQRLNLNPETGKDTLYKVPKNLKQLKKLKSLSLCNNKLTKLPRWFHKLKDLEILCIGGNEKLDMKQVMDELSKLPKLRYITIGLNSDTTLNHTFSKLKSLELLNVIRNPNWNLRTLMLELSHLDSFKALNISMNEIESIPDEISRIKNLEVLVAKYNKLEYEEISRIQKLIPNVEIIYKNKYE